MATCCLLDKETGEGGLTKAVNKLASSYKVYAISYKLQASTLCTCSCCSSTLQMLSYTIRF